MHWFALSWILYNIQAGLLQLATARNVIPTGLASVASSVEPYYVFVVLT